MSVERYLRGLAAACFETARSARLLPLLIGILKLARGLSRSSRVPSEWRREAVSDNSFGWFILFSMTLSDLTKIVVSILAALGGGAAIIAGFSSWLGKIWAARLMEKEKARHQKDLEEFKTEAMRYLEKEKAQYQEKLEALRGKLSRENDLTGQTLREKISLYKTVIPPIVDLVLQDKIAPADVTPELMKEFEKKRLETTALLGMFAPVPVFEAYNVMIDYMFDCFEGKRVFAFPEFRSRAFAMLSQIRRDVGIVGDEQFTGGREYDLPQNNSDSLQHSRAARMATRWWNYLSSLG